MIPRKDDGKVSVASAQFEGISAFKVVHATHTLIIKKKTVIEDVLRFLETGAFQITSDSD